MKKLIILFLLNSAISLFAQQPEVTFKDLGFTKKVKKVETYSYSLEDKMVIDKSSDSYDFDDNGNIIHHEYHIFGKYASSTSESSEFVNGTLIKRETLVENRPNFNSVLTYEYDKKVLVKKIYKSALFKNDFFFKYNKNGQLAEIKGVYANNYSIEEFFYNDKVLYKSVVKYFSKEDKIQSETIKLYLNDEVVLECKQGDSFFTAYLKDKKQNIELKMNLPDPIQMVNGIETEIKYEEITLQTLRENLLNDRNKPYRKIEVNEVLEQNEHNDWIVKAGIDNRYNNYEYFIFRKITYADGTVSGSTDFNIFKVNQLKSKITE